MFRAIGRLLCVLTIVGLVAQCSRRDTTPPVASVAASAVGTRVVQGGPLELAYRWELLPGQALAEDQRVFVQVLNAGGELVWSDDHEPAVPTSQWKVSQPVQYTRTSFLPTSLVTSDPLTVKVGLYRDGDRVPLQAGSEARDRAYPVAQFTLAPESDRIFLIYTGGWHPEEFTADGATSWKWTQKAATFSFKNPKADAVLLLEFDARADVFPGAPQQVSVYTSGQQLASFPAEGSTRIQKRVAIPAIALGTNEMTEMRIEVDKVFVPAELPAGGQDNRQLGIRVYHAFVDSR